MPSWDADSPRLRRNLERVLKEIVSRARLREAPKVDSARRWQTFFMKGLNVPEPRFIGAFRGGPELEGLQVKVGSHYGVPPAKVAKELRHFESTLQNLITQLDSELSFDDEPDADQLAAVIDVCGWSHAEWVRIHPFGNGNGRTARLWANFIAVRYGLPPFIRLRPRPDPGYANAGAQAMQGAWEPTATLFQQLLPDFLIDS
ncbi:MAG: Fic family protein [Candidatus Sulfotelmatobacter sp.]